MLTPSGDDEVTRALLRVARGDADAFGVLYELTSTRVHSAVRSVLRSEDHTVEVTQEVFLQVWRQSDRYDPALGTGTAWILTLARRRAIDRVRSVARRTALEDRVLRRDDDRGVDEVWEATRLHIESRQAKRALATLSPPQRQVLTLLYLSSELYTHQQVAALLGVPLGTVKSRIRDGLAVLRQLVLD